MQVQDLFFVVDVQDGGLDAVADLVLRLRQPQIRVQDEAREVMRQRGDQSVVLNQRHLPRHALADLQRFVPRLSLDGRQQLFLLQVVLRHAGVQLHDLLGT